ncbi:MAG: hypothetical protein U0531_20725 [Dehalococcoidia bacterium]
MTAISWLERVSAAAGLAAGHAQIVGERLLPEEERAVIGRVMDLSLPRKLRLARRLWRDRRLDPVARTPLLAAMDYAVLPVKVTPVRLGPFREIEKVVGLGVLLWLLVRLAPRDVVVEHLTAIEPPTGS